MSQTETRPEASPPPPEHLPPTPRPAGVSVRAVGLGMLLIPLLIFWLEYTEIVASGPDLAAMSLPMIVLFALLVLVGINLIIKRLRPRAALTQGELLTVYAMNAVAVPIGGIGMMQFLTPELVGWQHFATRENHWDTWQHYLPAWAVPDPAVIPAYYVGKSSLLAPGVLEGWAMPIAVWSGFLLLLLGCFYCVSALLRRQWVERERLIFPIVLIPLEVTRGGGDTPLWRSSFLWGGVGLAAVLETVAVIHFTFAPTFPYFPIKPEPALQLDQNITTPPWNAIGYTTLSFYPLVVGLTYLLSLEVSFSCWFFYLFSKLQNVGATAFGFRDPGAGPTLAHMPYVAEQGFGAFLGLALYTLFLARPQLVEAWRKAFGLRGSEATDDSREPLSYRAAWLGLMASAAGLVGFGIALGLSAVLSVLFFGLFLLAALAMTRIRAEAGLPWGPGGQGGWPGAHTVMVDYGGTSAYRGQELTALTMLRWFDSDLRCLVQPAQAEAMKVGDAVQPASLNPRHLTGAIFAATVVGIAAAWACCLGIYYHYGADSATINAWRTGQGHYGYDQLQGWLNAVRPLDTGRIGGAGVGVAVVLLLGALRMRLPWWPLHPIGYAVGSTDTMAWIWFPVLLGWLAKSLLLRYGGVKVYRQALPFFMGLVIGDYSISCVWALYFLATGHAGYRTFPI